MSSKTNAKCYDLEERNYIDGLLYIIKNNPIICDICNQESCYCNNKSKNIPNLYETINLFNKYKKDKQSLEFYEWLKINSDYITDYELLKNIYDIFDFKKTNLTTFEKIKIVNGHINCENIKNILKTDGFIFPPF